MYASVCVRSLKRDREKEIIWVFYRERERRWEIWGLLWVSLCLSAFKRVCKRERQRQRMRSCDRDRERERERTRGLRKGVRRWLSGTVCRERFTLSHKPSLKYSHTHTHSLSPIRRRSLAPSSSCERCESRWEQILAVCVPSSSECKPKPRKSKLFFDI